MTERATDRTQERPEGWPPELEYGPDDLITSIENMTGEKVDVSGEPLWRRLWYKLLRIA